MPRLVRIVRNVEFVQLFDTFLVTAITTILVVRFYLKLTGYPQIGRSSLHIAHLLPGTLLMLAAILVLLSAVNRAARGFAAVTAGLGFGLAWDELGKFITKDNNYFFHATPGLIYLTFVILYLIVRYSTQRRFSQEEYLANLLDLIKDAAIKDLDQREYLHAKELLRQVSKENPLYELAKEMLERVKPSAEREPSLLDKVINAVKRPLVNLSRQDFFSKMIIGVAIVYGFTALAAAVFFFAGATLPDNYQVNTILQGDESDIIGGLSALVSAILVAAATYKYMRGKSRRAFKLFEQGLLVNIFIGQVVLFFKSQGIAIGWLAITLFLLINLEILSAEKKRLKPTP
ncbi:MAG TPA: hypothetical protein VFK97_01075 [Candidatus Saccharimonadales bacterium]|nr:hypothetical protein [Candidatus Saccharimonadales bacterium]